MAHQHDHADDGHDHPAAPMVEEITDYEVLEIAVRELAIEHGLFTAEDHRKFTEWAEQLDQLRAPAGSPKHGQTQLSMRASSITAPTLARRLASIGLSRPDPAHQAIIWSFAYSKTRQHYIM